MSAMVDDATAPAGRARVANPQQHATSEREASLAALRFWVEVGVDTLLDDFPHNRFAEIASLKASALSSPARDSSRQAQDSRSQVQESSLQVQDSSSPPGMGSAVARVAEPPAAADVRPATPGARPVASDALSAAPPAAPGAHALMPNFSESTRRRRAPLPGEGRAPLPGEALESVSARTQAARDLAASAETLEALIAGIAESKLCALVETATQCVVCDGNPHSRLMIIGEAPGAEEDRLGKPFVGPSGRLLSAMLAAVGIPDREHYFITNSVFWRPPGNRTPTEEETQICLPFVDRLIDFVKPSRILLLGGHAARTLLGVERIGKARGHWHSLEAYGEQYQVLPSFHPSYLLRQPGAKAHSWLDMLTLTEGFADDARP